MTSDAETHNNFVSFSYKKKKCLISLSIQKLYGLSLSDISYYNRTGEATFFFVKICVKFPLKYLLSF